MATSFMIPVYVIFAFAPLLILHEYAYKKLGSFLIRILASRKLLVEEITLKNEP